MSELQKGNQDHQKHQEGSQNLTLRNFHNLQWEHHFKPNSMNLETRRFILGLILAFLGLFAFLFAYKLSLSNGYTLGLIFS